MKKILFIIPYIPYPLDSGGNQAFFNMVNYIRNRMSVSILLCSKSEEHDKNIVALKKLWANVDFFVYKWPKKKSVHIEVRNPLYYNVLKRVKASVERKMRRQIVNMGVDMESGLDPVRENSALLRSVFEPLESGYAQYICQVIKQGYDIIQVEFYELISVGYLLPENVQTIFVHHELRYVRNANEMSLFEEMTDEDRMLFSVAKDYERAALLKYKHVIALTEVDRQLLIDFLGRKERIYASPAVVQMSDTSIEEFTPAITHRLTFVGSGDHYPNLDAITWFCKEVAPYLHKQGFSFDFRVAGRWDCSHIVRLSSVCPEIKFVGYMEDLSDFLKGSIALVPIRIGSGLRMKILDAVLSKVPFVTTAKGVEGIDFKDGEDCLIVDDPAGFAEAVIALSSNPQLQRQLVTHAEDSLRQVYNPGQMQERRLAVYEQILGDKVG